MGDALSRLRFAGGAGLVACLVTVVAVSAMAQAPGPAERRESTVIGGQPSGSTVQRCVDVQIGGDSAFGCLNEKLRREVDKVNPTLNLPPIDARSSDVRVGNANEAAVRQQYGSNYGRSATPFRPPPIANVLPHR
nr:hypothetical protein [Bradyrhizobium diazoefficiens]